MNKLTMQVTKLHRKSISRIGWRGWVRCVRTNPVPLTDRGAL